MQHVFHINLLNISHFPSIQILTSPHGVFLKQFIKHSSFSVHPDSYNSTECFKPFKSIAYFIQSLFIHYRVVCFSKQSFKHCPFPVKYSFMHRRRFVLSAHDNKKLLPLLLSFRPSQMIIVSHPALSKENYTLYTDHSLFSASFCSTLRLRSVFDL